MALVVGCSWIWRLIRGIRWGWGDIGRGFGGEGGEGGGGRWSGVGVGGDLELLGLLPAHANSL